VSARLLLSATLRVAPGPLAVAGFFLPWAAGPGPLAAVTFSGYSLVGFAGRLQALDLAPQHAAALWAVRLLVLGVLVAGSWLTLLAPAHRWHPAYRCSGWYLAAAATMALLIGAGRSGVVRPSPGLALVATSAALFVAAELAPIARRVGAKLRSRSRKNDPLVDAVAVRP